ncbi:MAG: hypothetical protein MZV70_48630 [Desulfobacterales bacterium]|nr:hypothetical protein [Desulfobacterales bacterium]
MSRKGKVLPGVFVQGRGRENLDAIITQLQADISGAGSLPMRGSSASNSRETARSRPAPSTRFSRARTRNILTDADLSADIKAIFKMGYFDDVTAEVADVAEGKVITFVVAGKTADHRNP